MSKKHEIRECSGPGRILLVSMRGSSNPKWRCFTFEFEDVIQAMDDVARVDLGVNSGKRVWRGRRWLDRSFPKLSASFGDTTRLPNRRFDMVFVSCGFLGDLKATIPLQKLLDAGDITACFVEEVWSHNLEQRKELKWLRRFDYLFTECHGSVDMLQTLTGRPTLYIPPAVDTLRWCTTEPRPRQCIDILWYGRRLENTHMALKALATRHSLYYVYDTMPRQPRACVRNVSEHRESLAQLVQRTHCVIVNPAKVDQTEERADQEEVGYRFFEAAAGGAVLIGDHPRTSLFESLFGWPEAVVRLPRGSADVEPVVMPILEDSLHRSRISLRNRLESVRRHDVAYRWRLILQTLAMPETDKMKQRLTVLGNLEKSLTESIQAIDPSQAHSEGRPRMAMMRSF